MKKLTFAALASAAVLAASPASAAHILFTSTFEGTNNSDNLRTAANDPGLMAPANTFGFYMMADGWNATGPNNPIELQRNAGAGLPAPGVGGQVFVELDSSRNSEMSRLITRTNDFFTLSFLYSPRPNQPMSTNGIQVLLDGVLFNPPGTIAQAGLAGTSWSSYTINFAATKGQTLTFRAVGGNDSLGGYVDNISLAVPEPATWAMMIMGFGLIGGALRSRKANVTARVRFA